MKVLAIPEADELLEEDIVSNYLYNKTLEEASNEPFCVLHTSGSTGHPKLIMETLPAWHLGRHPFVARVLWSSSLGCCFLRSDRLYSAFPFFHVRRLSSSEFSSPCIAFKLTRGSTRAQG